MLKSTATAKQGRKGLGDQVDATYENTRICVDELKRRSGRFVTLMDEFDSNLVSFYHIPEPVRSKLEAPERMTEFLKDHKVRCRKLVCRQYKLMNENMIIKI